jgi:DNA-binding transcriptional ArsR family regulator
MGITKSHLYSEEHNEQAELFKALGHPARLKIVIYLLRVKSCICGDIVGEIKLSQPTITRHLKVLKDADIIKGTIDGNQVCYCINAESFRALKEIILLIEGEASGIDGTCC